MKSDSFSHRFPDVLRLERNLHLARFENKKIIPALAIAQDALDSGLLKREKSTWIDTSSGTYAMALARVCAGLGIRLKIVTGPSIGGLKSRLEAFGVSVYVVEDAAESGGIQQARLNRLTALLDATSWSFTSHPYSNPLIPKSYASCAAHVLQALDRPPDILVDSVGSGGSLMGFAEAIRNVNPDLKVVAVDVPNSVLFGLSDGPREVPGMGNSIMPGNLDHEVIDEVHWIPPRLIYAFAHHLARDHGLFPGLTASASYGVAQKLASSNPSKTVLFLQSDTGHRYGDVWRDCSNFNPDVKLNSPTMVQHPSAVTNSNWWYCMKWTRRSLSDVLSEEPRALPKPKSSVEIDF